MSGSKVKVKRKVKVEKVFAVACMDCGYMLELISDKPVRCLVCGNYTVVIGSRKT